MKRVSGVVGDGVINLTQGRARFLGCETAVFELGEDFGVAVWKGSDLHSDFAEFGVHAFDAAGEGITLHLATAHAEGRAFKKEDVLESVGLSGLGQDLEQDAGAVFLHLSRQHGNIERSRTHEALGQVADELGGFVVDVGFEEDKGFGDDAIGLGTVPEDEAEDVGDLHVARSSAIAKTSHGHRGNGAKAVGDLGKDRRSGGGHEFGIDFATHDGASPHQGEGRGSGKGDLAMGTGDEAAAYGKGRDMDFFDSEGFESREGATDIHNSIYPTDLMKMHFLDIGVVNGSLGFANTGEDANGGGFDFHRKSTLFHDLAQVGKVAFGGLIVHVDIDFGSREAILHDLVDVKVEVLEVKLGQFGFQGFGRESGIDKDF